MELVFVVEILVEYLCDGAQTEGALPLLCLLVDCGSLVAVSVGRLVAVEPGGDDSLPSLELLLLGELLLGSRTFVRVLELGQPDFVAGRVGCEVVAAVVAVAATDALDDIDRSNFCHNDKNLNVKRVVLRGSCESVGNALFLREPFKACAPCLDYKVTQSAMVIHTLLYVGRRLCAIQGSPR